MDDINLHSNTLKLRHGLPQALSHPTKCHFSPPRSERHRGEKKMSFSLYSSVCLLYFLFSLFNYTSQVYNSSVLELRGEQVRRLHFYPSLEKTSVSHVKYLHGHLVLFSPFLSSLCLSSTQNIQKHFTSLYSLCSLQ